jgi:CTP:molybdopterin cytidylyltransferase MocA
MVSGVVLAAGLSRRMGRPKPYLPYGGDTLLGRALRVAERSRLGELVLVVGPHTADAFDAVRHPGVRVALNPRPEDGQSGSLRLGLGEVSPGSDAALILMSDQPELTPRLLDRLIEEYEREPAGALVPTYAGVRGSPVVLGRAIWPLIEGLSGDTGARALLARRPELVRTVEVGALGDPADIDTPEQYRRLLERGAGG